MNPTAIDWPGLTHTWNPGYGCLRGCTYCYARELHIMRMVAKASGAKLPVQYDVPFNEIQYFMSRLKIVKKSRVVKKVFVGSMSDICYWNPDFMALVLNVIRERPEINFMFLTKDPKVYYNYIFPLNCVLGVTVTSNNDFRVIHILDCLFREYSQTFVSIEPILGDCSALDLTNIGLVIVGTDSRKGAAPPKREWIDSIKHPNIHYKKNVHKYVSQEIANAVN